MLTQHIFGVIYDVVGGGVTAGRITPPVGLYCISSIGTASVLLLVMSVQLCLVLCF